MLKYNDSGEWQCLHLTYRAVQWGTRVSISGCTSPYESLPEECVRESRPSGESVYCPLSAKMGSRLKIPEWQVSQKSSCRTRTRVHVRRPTVEDGPRIAPRGICARVPLARAGNVK